MHATLFVGISAYHFFLSIISMLDMKFWSGSPRFFPTIKWKFPFDFLIRNPMDGRRTQAIPDWIAKGRKR